MLASIKTGSGQVGQCAARGLSVSRNQHSMADAETMKARLHQRIRKSIRSAALSNAPRLSCAARAGGRPRMTCGARWYVGAQMEFCQDRAAAASTASYAATARLSTEWRSEERPAG